MSQQKKLTTVFFGTSEFGAIVLEKLVQAGMVPVLVVTAPDMPIGRKQVLTPPPVKVSAQKYDVPVFQSDSIPNTKYKILNTNPDLIVLAAYGRIIPKAILEIPTHGALNIHPSLLPKYRGPTPVQTAILNGEKTTGVTIILMDEKIDHGPIVANIKCQITNDKVTYPELHNQLAELGGDLLVKTMPQWFEGKITPKEQDHSQATYTKKLAKEDGSIDWGKSAEYIERQVRALSPWPGTYTLVKSEIRNPKSETNSKLKVLKILKASVLHNREGETGKTFQTEDGKLAVYTGKYALLIDELQLEGGKPINSKEFLLGHREFIGIALQ